jgi:hypothetical protein
LSQTRAAVPLAGRRAQKAAEAKRQKQSSGSGTSKSVQACMPRARLELYLPLAF